MTWRKEDNLVKFLKWKWDILSSSEQRNIHLELSCQGILLAKPGISDHPSSTHPSLTTNYKHVHSTYLDSTDTGTCSDLDCMPRPQTLPMHRKDWHNCYGGGKCCCRSTLRAESMQGSEGEENIPPESRSGRISTGAWKAWLCSLAWFARHAHRKDKQSI